MLLLFVTELIKIPTALTLFNCRRDNQLRPYPADDTRMTLCTGSPPHLFPYDMNK